MSRLTIARALTGAGLGASGVMAGTIAGHLSLLGILGVIVTTPSFCPESIGSARCNSAGFKAAGLAVYGLIGAGAAGGLLMAGKLTDPEA